MASSRQLLNEALAASGGEFNPMELKTTTLSEQGIQERIPKRDQQEPSHRNSKTFRDPFQLLFRWGVFEILHFQGIAYLVVSQCFFETDRSPYKVVQGHKKISALCVSSDRSDTHRKRKTGLFDQYSE